jgi:hypothetical protein
MKTTLQSHSTPCLVVQGFPKAFLFCVALTLNGDAESSKAKTVVDTIVTKGKGTEQPPWFREVPLNQRNARI